MTVNLRIEFCNWTTEPNCFILTSLSLSITVPIFNVIYFLQFVFRAPMNGIKPMNTRIDFSCWLFLYIVLARRGLKSVFRWRHGGLIGFSKWISLLLQMSYFLCQHFGHSNMNVMKNAWFKRRLHGLHQYVFEPMHFQRCVFSGARNGSKASRPHLTYTLHT